MNDDEGAAIGVGEEIAHLKNSKAASPSKQYEGRRLTPMCDLITPPGHSRKQGYRNMDFGMWLLVFRT